MTYLTHIILPDCHLNNEFRISTNLQGSSFWHVSPQVQRNIPPRWSYKHCDFESKSLKMPDSWIFVSKNYDLVAINH